MICGCKHVTMLTSGLLTISNAVEVNHQSTQHQSALTQHQLNTGQLPHSIDNINRLFGQVIRATYAYAIGLFPMMLCSMIVRRFTQPLHGRSG